MRAHPCIGEAAQQGGELLPLVVSEVGKRLFDGCDTFTSHAVRHRHTLRRQHNSNLASIDRVGLATHQPELHCLGHQT